MTHQWLKDQEASLKLRPLKRSAICQRTVGEHLSASGGFITQLRSGNLSEPPGADPLSEWCGEGERKTPPYPIRQFLGVLLTLLRVPVHAPLCQHRAGQEFGACGTRTQSFDIQMPLSRKDSLCDWLAGRIQLIDQHPGERSFHNASDLPISGHGDGNGFGVVVVERGLDE